MKNILLRKQLRRAGATNQEASDLAATAAALHDLVPHLEASVKQKIAQQIGLKKTPIYARPRFVLAGAFTVLIILSTVAQFAQPGSPLYALKRATEEVIVVIQPSFKTEIEHRREDERRHADDQQKVEDDRRGRDDDNSGRNGGKTDDSKTDDSSGKGSGESEDKN